MIDIHVLQLGNRYAIKIFYNGVNSDNLTGMQKERAAYFTRKCCFSCFMMRKNYTFYDSAKHIFSDGRAFNPFTNFYQILDSFNNLSKSELKSAIKIVKSGAENSEIREDYRFFYGKLKNDE